MVQTAMLNSKRRAELASLATRIDPVIHLGKAGMSEAQTKNLSAVLMDHELVKLRFVDFKGERRKLARELAAACAAELVRIIGNTAIFYKQNPDPEKRRFEGESPAKTPLKTTRAPGKHPY